MTKRTLLVSGLAGMALLAAPACDLAEAGEWSGFYIGLNAGGIWGDVDVTNVSEATTYYNQSPGDLMSFSPSGVMGGAQIGYNFQFSNWVIGLEAAGDFMDLDETQQVPTGDFETLGVESEWLFTGALRAGYTINSRTMIFMKGGYAAGNILTHFDDPSGTPNTTGFFETDETHNGFVVGGGFEHLISENVSFGIEYSYIDLGETDHSTISSGTGGGLVVNDVDAQLHAVTVRLNWHWNPTM